MLVILKKQFDRRVSVRTPFSEIKFTFENGTLKNDHQIVNIGCQDGNEQDTGYVTPEEFNQITAPWFKMITKDLIHYEPKIY